MKAKVLAAWVACLLLIPFCAWGDGCVFPAKAFAQVKIPDQRALIHYADGVETLVIDTSFKGEGTNFAWIVPVPSMPKVEASTTGLFPTLQMVFRPAVIHAPTRFYILVACVTPIGLFLISRWRRYRSVADILVTIFIILFLASMLLPAFATAGVSSVRMGNVKVLDRKRVGIYETATLSSRDSSALLAWLNQNGYATSTNFLATIHAYTQEGWYFVASKIRLDAVMDEPAKPHPLAFTFKTERPVYPLRLTGIGNDPCRIDLYVFGPGRAEVPGFTVERCAEPAYPAMKKGSFGGRNPKRSDLVFSDRIEVRHPGLRQLVDKSPVATKLSGTLGRAEMKADAYVKWVSYEPKQLTFYSWQGAADTAANIAISVIALAVLLWYSLGGSQTERAQVISKYCVLSVPVSLLAGILIFAALPKIPVTVTKRPAMFTAMLHTQISDYLMSLEQGTNAQLTLSRVRQELAEGSEFRREGMKLFQNNFYSGQPWREEDSPGNYTLRQTGQGIEYVWYDVDGGEYIDPLYPAKGRK